MNRTTNLELKKPEYSDAADIEDINDNMDSIDEIIGAVPSGSTVQGQIDGVNTKIGTIPSGSTVVEQIEEKTDDVAEMIAPEFDQATENEVREYVTKDKGLYYLLYGHEADVAFDNFSKRQTTVGKELKHLDDLDIAQNKLDNEVFSYVQYYSNNFLQLAGGGTGTSAIGVQGYKYEFTLDGTPATTYWYCKITNGISRATSASGVRNLTGGVFLKSGHKYRLTQKRVSGSCTLISTGKDTLPLLRVYVKGTSTGVGTGIQNATVGIYTYDFTADNSEYIICFLMEDTKTLANYKCDIFLEDLTVKNLWGRDDAISIKGSATGNETSLEFPSGADGMPTETTFGFDPVQSFNGYDSPWSGGKGKNIFDSSSVPDTNQYVNSRTGALNTPTSSSGSKWRASDYIPVLENTTYFIGGCTFATASTAGLAFYDSSQNFISGSGINSTDLGSSQGVCIAPTDAAYIRISFCISDGLNPDWETSLFVCKNGDLTSYEPYENICPITGATSVTFKRAGKLLDYGSFTENKYISDVGVITNSTIWKYTPSYTEVEPSTTYTFATEITTSQPAPVGGNVCFYTNAKAFIRRDVMIPASDIGSATGFFKGTFTTPENAKYIRFNVRLTSQENVISTGDVDKYTIAFPEDAGTVYGGTLSIDKNGLAKLTVTDAEIAEYNGETLPSTWISDRDVYAEGATPTTGAQVVYKLATAVNYRFVALEINTVVGTNTIWTTNTGDILNVDYTADTKTYIDNLFSSIVNATGVSF